jgi:hypothetical protein
MITSAELERALLTYKRDIYDDFELHILEGEGTPRLELRIHPKHNTNVDFTSMAEHVARTLRISPERTLADIVRAGLVTEMKCGLLSADTERKKQLRIYVHSTGG